MLQGDTDFNEPLEQGGFVRYFSKVDHLQTMNNILGKTANNNKKQMTKMEKRENYGELS